MKNKIPTVIFMITVLTLCVFGPILHRTFASNATMFITWLTFISAVIQEAGNKGDALRRYADPNSGHLPKWVDLLYYNALIITLAGCGWYWMAALTGLSGGIDLGLRAEAKKLEAAKGDQP